MFWKACTVCPKKTQINKGSFHHKELSKRKKEAILESDVGGMMDVTKRPSHPLELRCLYSRTHSLEGTIGVLSKYLSLL